MKYYLLSSDIENFLFLLCLFVFFMYLTLCVCLRIEFLLLISYHIKQTKCFIFILSCLRCLVFCHVCMHERMQYDPWPPLHVITTCGWVTVISKQQFPKSQSIKFDFFWRHDKFWIHWNVCLFRPLLIKKKKIIYYKRKMCLQSQEYQDETDCFMTQLLLALQNSSDQIDESFFMCPVMILQTHLCRVLHRWVSICMDPSTKRANRGMKNCALVSPHSCRSIKECAHIHPLTSHFYFAATENGWSISGCWKVPGGTASGMSHFAPSTGW